MSHYLITWLRSLRREEGQDLAEDALLAALVAVALVLIMSGLASAMGDVLNAMRKVLADAVGGRTLA